MKIWILVLHEFTLIMWARVSNYRGVNLVKTPSYRSVLRRMSPVKSGHLGFN